MRIRFVSLIFFIVFLSFIACGNEDDHGIDLIELEKSLKLTLGSKGDELKNVTGVLIIPIISCETCQTPTEIWVQENIDDLKNLVVVYTGNFSKKIFSFKYKELLKNSILYIDNDNNLKYHGFEFIEPYYILINSTGNVERVIFRKEELDLFIEKLNGHL